MLGRLQNVGLLSADLLLSADMLFPSTLDSFTGYMAPSVMLDLERTARRVHPTKITYYALTFINVLIRQLMVVSRKRIQRTWKKSESVKYFHPLLYSTRI